MGFLYKKNSLPLLLLALNTVGSYIWVFGLHSLRLYLLSATCLILLLLLFFSKSPTQISFFKFWIFIMFLIGLQNIQSGYIPILVVDLSSLGIIGSAFLIKNIDLRQLKRIGIFLFLVPVSYYIYTVPSLNLELLTLGDFKRELAVSSISDEILTGGAHKSYVIYMTQQLMTLYLNLFLLLLPLYYNFFKKKTIIIMLLVSVSFLVLIASFYQKKQGLTELFLIIVLSLMFYRTLLKNLLTRNVVISLIIIGSLIGGLISFTFIEGLLLRFQDLADNIKEYDRFEETKIAFSNFSILDIMFGKGFGSFVKGTVGYSMLHIGYSNLILKGGIVLLFIYLFNTISNIKYCFVRRKSNPIFNVGIVLSLYSMLQLSYTGGYHFYAPIILTGLAMFSRFPLTIANNKLYAE